MSRCALQSVKPLQKLKRKTVYFVKTAPARLDNDNIRTLVSPYAFPALKSFTS